MHRKTLGIALVLVTALAPAAAATTNYLVHVHVGSLAIAHIGTNPLTAGDFLDVGIGNTQCDDHEDVLDVSAFNEEGCPKYGADCPQDHDQALLEFDTPVTPAPPPGVRFFPRAERACTDDADAIDVGVFNCEQTDDRDFLDVGVVNAERSDNYDTIDIGIFNHEVPDIQPAGTIDVNSPDGNGGTCYKLPLP